MEAVGRTTAEMRPRPRADDGNLASDQRSGATPAGEASAESGGADSDRGEWGVGREKWGAVVGTSWGDDSSSKDDASKGGGAVVEPRNKIPQQPGSQASREIWASEAVRPAGQSGQPGNLGLPG